MCQWNEIYWEAYLYDQPNMQTVIYLYTSGQEEFWTKWDRYNMK